MNEFIQNPILYLLTGFMLALIVAPTVTYFLRKNYYDKIDSTAYGVCIALVFGLLWPIAIVLIPVVIVAAVAAWGANK